MNSVKWIKIFLLATCLSNQLHDDALEMAGMRRAVEQSTKEPYRPILSGVGIELHG
jgi:hypothetical protein